MHTVHVYIMIRMFYQLLNFPPETYCEKYLRLYIHHFIPFIFVHTFYIIIWTTSQFLGHHLDSHTKFLLIQLLTSVGVNRRSQMELF